ncbi:TPA: hypothetical protein I7730_00920 [Vibrio vulnificus]|uniref:Uncharacterized protein n=1 Tax=Vibrio vulnificus TaxID=672 RepID=A0A8H9K5K1_VIBVL|nr:hypothetical protein [Vibrio vulnificus]HAS8538361.1 hypothetical protein [Vibrio vulnificus]
MASASANAVEVSLSAEQQDVSTRWSVDNSSLGGLPKQSEIVLSAKPIVYNLGLNWGDQYKLNFFYGVDSEGEFRDKDWCGKNLIFGIYCDQSADAANKQLWSDDNSIATDYMTAGLAFESVWYRTGMWHGLGFQLDSEIGFTYEQYDSYGLYSNLENTEKFDSGVSSNVTKSYWLEYKAKPSIVWEIYDFDMKLQGVGGLTTGYMVDSHPLRDDLKDPSFELISAYIVYGANAELTWQPNDFGMTVYGGFESTKSVAQDAVHVNYKDSRGKLGAGLGESERTESKAGLKIFYNF